MGSQCDIKPKVVIKQVVTEVEKIVRQPYNVPKEYTVTKETANILENKISAVREKLEIKEVIVEKEVINMIEEAQVEVQIQEVFVNIESANIIEQKETIEVEQIDIVAEKKVIEM